MEGWKEGWPWSALVPFADCLNHTNRQTKYDYDIEQNGMFRLFPTGKNKYEKGGEVFNSYGRRTNSNLLLEYGFAMMDNEWDTVRLRLNVTNESLVTREKIACLMRHGISILRHDFGNDQFSVRIQKIS